LSADGKLYTCLFALTGHDIRHALRDGASDEELAQLISGYWRARTDRYSERRAEIRSKGDPEKIEMFSIGG
jgi:cyclic pyranopterin phosphate synthase